MEKAFVCGDVCEQETDGDGRETVREKDKGEIFIVLTKF